MKTLDTKELMEQARQRELEDDVKKALPEIQMILKKYNLNLQAELVYMPNSIMPKPVFNRQVYDNNNNIDNPNNPAVLDSGKNVLSE